MQARFAEVEQLAQTRGDQLVEAERAASQLRGEVQAAQDRVRNAESLADVRFSVLLGIDHR